MKKLLLTLLLLSTLSQAAEYKVVVKGQEAGVASFNFIESDTSYKADLTLYPNMLAKVFGINDMREHAEGIINKGHYYPKHYSRKTLKGKTLLSVDFKGKQVTGSKEGNIKQFAINSSGQDPLSQIIQIKHDVLNNKVSKTYYLVTEKSQRHYNATVSKHSTGNQVSLKQQGADRAIKLWFDTKGVLQRMTKIKNGKKQFDMSIK